MTAPTGDIIARSKKTPKVLILLIVALFASSILPVSLGIVIELSAIVAGYIWWFSRAKSVRRGKAAIYLSIAIVLVWAALVLHPNVPNIEVGLHGLRKTALCVAGLALGASVPCPRRANVELTVVRILVVALVVSIFVHLALPELEQAVSRGAGVYTGVYAGRPRLQGIFSGPFHVALAATVLTGWGVVRWRSAPATASVALVVSATALYLAMVRSGLVAVVLVILVASTVAYTFRQALRRAVVAGVGITLAIVGWFLFEQESAEMLLGSIVNLDEDSRYMNRFPGYERGIQYFAESPIIGWGAGSAGDTLGPEFAQGVYVGSHNIVLKIAVEAGLIGIALWLILIIVAVRTTKAKSVERRMVYVLLTALFSIGMTVASLEALPVSLLIFVLIGLQLERSGGVVRQVQSRRVA